MSLELKVYDNGDHTCLVWLPTDHTSIPNCRGFAIRRLKNGMEGYIHGFVGFSDGEKFDPQKPWYPPLQRYTWWDYDVTPGDTVQYCVIPAVGADKNSLKLAEDEASPMTEPMKVDGQCTDHISAFFNRGIIATQWISREFQGVPSKASILADIKQPGNKLRKALGGLVLPEVLSLLQETKANGGIIYAALYELNDPELIKGLLALGKHCNLILANGAFKSNTPPENDENAAVRKQLHGHVNLFDRIVTTGHFAHNKFVVFCDKSGKATKVLTGSLNWTSTGLCTQANNSIIVDDVNVANDYLAAWERIKNAGNGYPAELVDGNSEPPKPRTVDGCNVTPWFVKTSKAQDLEYARKLIAAAKSGILFLFFNPGVYSEDPIKETLLQNILDRHNSKEPSYDPNLYLCGVANQAIAGLTSGGKSMANGSSAKPVTLFKNSAEPTAQLNHDVLIPHAIKSQFHDWEQELLGAGLVNVHSKVVVLDPFGDHPVVMTGSHNLGFKASNANDDNLIILEGNAPLAAAYAVNIIAIYNTYRWNGYVEDHRNDPKVWHGLVDNDAWQKGYLTGAKLNELHFWMGEAPSDGGTTPPPKGKKRAVGTIHASDTRSIPQHARGHLTGTGAHKGK